MSMWSACWCVTRMAVRSVSSSKPCENFPGSIRIRASSDSTRTQACSYLVIRILATLGPPATLRAMAFTTRPTLRGTFGMVSSTHWLASQCAMAVLERDGNAFDAAVAAGFVLHVVEPHLNGPGGEVPAVFARGDDPRPVVLAGQGPAPAGATIEHFRGLGLSAVPGTG